MENKEQKERCENCKFWKRYEETKSNEGACRRFPRTVVESVRSSDRAGSHTDQYAFDTYSETINVFPLHDYDDWCGEYKEKA